MINFFGLNCWEKKRVQQPWKDQDIVIRNSCPRFPPSVPGHTATGKQEMVISLDAGGAY